MMKIDLRKKSSINEIKSVRSQIVDKGQLVKFDEFIAKNDVFDFNNDEHLQQLKKGGNGSGCTCNITISPTISTK